MKQADFQTRYRETYARLRFTLTTEHGVPAISIAAAKPKLQLKIPGALRNCYLSAGEEKMLNTASDLNLTWDSKPIESKRR